MTLIIKNTDIIEHNWGGIVIAASDQYTMQEIDRLRFLSDSIFLSDLSTDVAVINNGDSDLTAEQGFLYLNNQLVFIHEDMDLYPAVGENAAEAIRISSSVAGFRFAIGEEMFTQGRLDDIVGDMVEFETHWCIDNSTSDRWIAFEISLITTRGGDDKVMTTPDSVTTSGPFLVPTTPNLIFRLGAQLSSAFFQNSEKYIYFGIKRVDVTGLGKNNPTNSPVLLRICKLYTRRLDE